MATYLVYKPEGAEPRKWNIEEVRLMSPEVIALEKSTEMTLGEALALIDRGSFTAIHAIAWVLMKREVPGLRYEDFVCAVDEFEIESDDDPKEPPASTRTSDGGTPGSSPSDSASVSGN